MSVDLSELDQVVALIPAHPVVVDQGFTVWDLAEKLKTSRPTASRKITDLERKGKVKCVGYRPGRNGEKVWELVTPAAQNQK
jgi:DNA-binding MarR family transcriptional regulator